MRSRVVRALLVRAGEEPQVVDLPNGERMCGALQDLVGGTIELLPIRPPHGRGGHSVVAYVHGEGTLLRLPISRTLTTSVPVWTVYGLTNEVPVHGPAVLVRMTRGGNEQSLSEDEIAEWTKRLALPEPQA